MNGQQELIQDTITNPDFINQDKNFSDRQCYYKILNPPILGATHLRVVTEKRVKTRTVISAFTCMGPAKGEKQIWKKK